MASFADRVQRPLGLRRSQSMELEEMDCGYQCVVCVVSVMLCCYQCVNVWCEVPDSGNSWICLVCTRRP